MRRAVKTNQTRGESKTKIAEQLDNKNSIFYSINKHLSAVSLDRNINFISLQGQHKT